MNRSNKVLTNSPTHDQQLAIMEYWELVGGLTKMLPATRMTVTERAYTSPIWYAPAK